MVEDRRRFREHPKSILTTIVSALVLRRHPFCVQGDATALTWLGVVYWTGWGGVPTDDVAAEDYFQRAAALGDADAQSWLEELRSRVAG